MKKSINEKFKRNTQAPPTTCYFALHGSNKEQLKAYSHNSIGAKRQTKRNGKENQRATTVRIVFDR